MPRPTGTRNIRVDYLNDGEIRLLNKYADKINKQCKRVILKPLGRFGASGAKVFVAYFDEKGGSLPFAVKIHEARRIQREENAINKIHHVFEDALGGFEAVYHGPYGALAYKLIATRAALGEFKTWDMKSLMDQNLSISRIEKLFDTLYGERCEKAHKLTKLRNVNLLKEYRRYLRSHKAKVRINTIVGGSTTERIEYLDTEIYNPLVALEKAFKQQRSVACGPVHGDLHPSNVVVEHDASRSAPHLIDFAWAHSGHVLKDFVLMENSVRFFMLPKFVNLAEQLTFDRLLLDETYAVLPQGAVAVPMASIYHRTARIVAMIRKHARVAGGADYDFRDYLAAQFLVLYGLLKINDYPIHLAVRALGLIADRLKAESYF